MRNEIHIGVYRNPSARRVEVYVSKDADFNNITHAQPVEYGKPSNRNEGNLEMPPTLSLEYETAARLMDQLWAAGIRPEADAGTQSTIEAMKAHLKDLQRLVFDMTK